MNRVLAALVLAISLTVTAVAGAAVASAHATRVATDPVENTELTKAPQKVSATFNEKLQPQFAGMDQYQFIRGAGEFCGRRRGHECGADGY